MWQIQLRQEGRQQVGQRRQLRAHPSGLGAAGPVQQQRHPHSGLVWAALARQAVVAQHLAVIGGEDHHRRFRKPEPVEALQDLPTAASTCDTRPAYNALSRLMRGASRWALCMRPRCRHKPEGSVSSGRSAASGRLCRSGSCERVPRFRRRERQVRLDPRAPQEERPLPAPLLPAPPGTGMPAARSTPAAHDRRRCRRSAAGTPAGRGCRAGSGCARRRAAGSTGRRRRRRGARTLPGAGGGAAPGGARRSASCRSPRCASRRWRGCSSWWDGRQAAPAAGRWRASRWRRRATP